MCARGGFLCVSVRASVSLRVSVRVHACACMAARVRAAASACVRRYASLRLVLTVHNVDQFDLRATVMLAQSSRLFVVSAPLHTVAVRLSAGRTAPASTG